MRVRGVTADGVPFVLRRVVATGHAEQVLAEFRAQARQYKDGIARPATRISLEEYSHAFRKKASWNPERRSTWVLLRPLWKLPLAAIGDSEVSSWAAEVIWTGSGRAPRGSGKASKAYILHAYELLLRILRQAVTDRLLPSVSISARPIGIPSQQSARKKRPPLSAGQVESIFKAADDNPYLLLRLELSATTGLRPKELKRAKVADLWDATPFCEGAPDGAAVLRCDKIKNGKEHLSPLPPELAEKVRAHIANLPALAAETGLIFPERSAGDSWVERKQWIRYDTWREVFRKARVPDSFVLYQLRHTRISEWSNRTDIGARRAADLVGHSDMRTTESYAARARGLVPEAFEPPAATRNKPPKPEKPTPGPGRKKKGPKSKHKKTTPAKGTPNPQKKPCPENARSRLEELAAEVERVGGAVLADRLVIQLGPECALFAAQMEAELADIGDGGLVARLSPLVVEVRAARPRYLRIVPARTAAQRKKEEVGT